MRKLNITIVVGIVVALIGAGLVFVYGHNVDNKISSGKRTVDVLVADQALGAGMTAGDVASHVHVAQIPSAYVVTINESIDHVATLQLAAARDALRARAAAIAGRMARAEVTVATWSGTSTTKSSLL